jgi:hypothetical protein
LHQNQQYQLQEHLNLLHGHGKIETANVLRMWM